MNLFFKASEFVQEDENSYLCSQDSVLKSSIIASEPDQDMHLDTSNNIVKVNILICFKLFGMIVQVNCYLWLMQ